MVMARYSQGISSHLCPPRDLSIGIPTEAEVLQAAVQAEWTQEGSLVSEGAYRVF